MAIDYVDVALVEVKRADGTTIVLEDVVDISIDITVNRQLVKTMNRRRRGRGYRRGVKEVTGSITVEKAVNPEFPWREVLNSGEILQVFYEEAEDGQRFHLVDFIVGDIGNEAGEDGEAQEKISFLAIDEVAD